MLNNRSAPNNDAIFNVHIVFWEILFFMIAYDHGHVSV